MKKIITFLLLVISASGFSQIKKFNESTSHYTTPIILDSSRGVFQYKDMYRGFMKAGTGFANLSKP